MAEIEKYRINDWEQEEPFMQPIWDGEYVLYRDHELIVKELEEENAALRNDVKFYEDHFSA